MVRGPDVIPSPDGVFRTPRAAAYAPDRLLVRFRVHASGTARAEARRSIAASVRRAYELVPGLELVTIARGSDVFRAAAELSRRPDVEYAMPDVAYSIQDAPDDPRYPEQWALPRVGAPAAWDRATGTPTIIVAVLDTGIDAEHPDLAANVVPGWNFVSDSADTTDDHGHGTHVAGIIGAVGNNGQGVAGINWSVGLMPLKICDAAGCWLSAEIAALEYAVDHGARVANASFGGPYEPWEPERDAIEAAGEAGLLYVAAAGNDHANNDGSAFYPASYPLENIIAVAASTPSDELTSFSNYGQSSVDLIAPGDGILSTVPGGYEAWSGTSMAAPQVAGAAALLRSIHPGWTPERVRRRLINTADPLSALAGKVASCGRLDLDGATDPLVAATPALCVSRQGTGLGSVVSSPTGIDCGETCARSYPLNTSVTLMATPVAGFTFAGWSGPVREPVPVSSLSARR
jgi:subtilisin family serine protease